MRSWYRLLVLFLVSSPLPVVAQTLSCGDLKPATQAYRNGEYDKVFALLDPVIKADPTCSKALLTRAAARYKAKNFGGAKEDYNQILKKDDKSSRAYGGRGIIYYEEGDLGRAESDFTKVIELDPGNANAFFQRATARQRLGKIDEAIADWNTLLLIDPTGGNAVSANLDLALLLFFKRKYSLALTSWQKAAELDSKSSEALAGQAIAHFRMGQKEEADNALKAALVLEPRYSSDPNWVLSNKDKGPGWNRIAADALRELLATKP
ncbi:tetratricopeptide repeat protein [Anthocerotibacter panamensis]|uniref:tetratricopeptide repeat protein n=1 Tax=Anthocerotibacter panamensis TaxID=2857077 RepID=UPI001C4031DB|nr:tetratricopeptide repeat protein [Anthocerotibacter panamensis]